MTTVEAPDPTRQLADDVGILVGRAARQRDRFEVVGLLLGLLGVLVVVAATIGTPQI